ncbi:MAG: histidine kinase [Ignavibacteriota bacterium]
MQPVAPSMQRAARTGHHQARSAILRHAGTRPHRPPLWTLILAAWLVPAVLSGFDSYVQDRLDGQPPHWRWIFFNSLDWLLYAVLTPLVFRTSRRFPLKRAAPRAAHRHPRGGALSRCASSVAALGSILRLAIFPWTPDMNAHKVWLGFVSWVFTTFPFGVGVYFALVGIQHSFFYFAQARERETQAARLAAQLSEARLGALRMQLNPHFLFNSLNAITVLVRDGNTVDASRMLELLSDVLRQVLRSDETHETSLAGELEFLERYLAIEQVRFSDRLRPSIQVDPAIAHAAVPRFLLQPLVENTLRHGIARRANAGLIEVRGYRDGDRLILTVRDDGPGLSATAAPTTGVGLANTRARLGSALRRQRVARRGGLPRVAASSPPYAYPIASWNRDARPGCRRRAPRTPRRSATSRATR